MGYHVVDPKDLETAPNRPSDMRYVSEAAGLKKLGLRVYDVEPGEEIPVSGLHYHDEQEEAFYVVSGVLSAETPDEEFTIAAGQFFIAEPNSPHRVYNDATTDSPVRVVGVGAPPVDDAHAFTD